MIEPRQHLAVPYWYQISVPIPSRNSKYRHLQSANLYFLSSGVMNIHVIVPQQPDGLSEVYKHNLSSRPFATTHMCLRSLLLGTTLRIVCSAQLSTEMSKKHSCEVWVNVCLIVNYCFNNSDLCWPSTQFPPLLILMCRPLRAQRQQSFCLYFQWIRSR